ncbi:MAG TPA: hypothetical protein VGL58_07295 [Caulobacteraceae bacterium]
MTDRGAALGFRPHTYWTAAVAVRDASGAAGVLARHKLVFAAGSERSVYHQAAELGVGASTDALLEKVRRAVVANARAGIERLLEVLARDGIAVTFAAAPAGGKKMPAMADIIRVHTLQHRAEGEFYRDCVAEACQSLGLAVSRPIEKELPALACDKLGVSRAALDAQLKDMGAKLGSPWSEDQRLATLAAWTAL